ncbi:NAD(P)-binding domain-containing protein [Priestia megaterium]|uniref:NAD(P)-dependent oxidoreductase n=1 Tax=Priestia megaterium TaxID=1404 RepID=UPI003672296C
MGLSVNKANSLRVGIIGFGEVGQIFAKSLLEKTDDVFIYDILAQNSQSFMADKISSIGAQVVERIEQLGEYCTLIFSLVSSSASETVASGIAKKIGKGTIFVDLTTSTPQVKTRSEKLIEATGGIYVDASIMGTVATEQQQVPLLIAGEHSEKIQKLLTKLGFNCQAISLPTGGAASIKLLRSIFMKGLEALILETMITAKNYGVSDEVMESISKTINNNDFTTFARALITTHAIHKNRRYKEVLDSCNLINEAGFPPCVTEGVISFFSNSTKMDIDQKIIESHDVEKILDQYSLMNIVNH